MIPLFWVVGKGLNEDKLKFRQVGRVGVIILFSIDGNDEWC
jgi:hypothetical protein